MLRIGMIGAGAIAATHAETLSRIEGAGVTAVFDVSRGIAEEFAGKYNARCCPDIDSLLGEVDAVFIGTPPRFHREAAVAAARDGVHIFCEKPLAVTVEDAEAIAEAVERSGVSCMVGFPFRYSPGFMRFKEVVESGVLGDVYSFWGIRVLWLPHLAPNWRTDPRFLCGMTVESLSHDFDFLRWLLGDVTQAFGQVATSRPDLVGYDNIMSAILTLKRGGTATFHSTWASHLSTLQYGIVGSGGSAICDGGTVRLKAGENAPEEVLHPRNPEDTRTAHQREVQYFIECLKTGEKPSVGVHDGVATVRISNAILRSAQEQRIIEI